MDLDLRFLLNRLSMQRTGIKAIVSKKKSKQKVSKGCFEVIGVRVKVLKIGGM